MAKPSLSTRLTRSVLCAIGVAWLLVAAICARYAQVEISEGMDATLVETSHRLLDLALRDPQALAHASSTVPVANPVPQVPQNDGRFLEEHLLYQVVDASGRVLLHSQNAPTQRLAVALTDGFTDLPNWRIYTYQHPAQGRSIHVADSLAHRQHAQRQITLWLLLPVAALLPLLALWIGWITRRHMAPLHQLSTHIGQRSGHNLSPIPGTALPPELQTITDSTNHLLSRLGDALDTERALAANAAHELRTPLATTLLRLHALLDLPLPPAARQEASKALESLNQLNRRAEKLLQMSRAESASALHTAPVSLVALAGTVAQEFWAHAGLLDRLHLHVPPEQDVLAQGDFDALAIVLRNLVENAVRYSGGSAIHITVALPATLQVQDFGPGVPPDTLARIRRRHVKHSPDAAGFGLGMSIITTIVTRHHGTLELQSPPAGQASGFAAVVHLLAV